MTQRLPSIDEANRTAVGRMIAAQPRLARVERALDAIPGMRRDLLLHAGPPIEWARMSGPLRGAIVGALLFEGLATEAAEAEALAASGRITFDSCHHHGAVGPMAGVTSASMQVYVLEETTFGGRAFSTFNEGYGKVLRYGAYSPDVLERMRFLHGDFASLIGAALLALGGLDMKALIAEALHMGDEGHNRNKAGSLLLLRALSPGIAGSGADAATRARALDFLGGNALSVLNPVMAAAKAMADAAHGVAGSTLVTAMARNGTEFGIRVSGLGERWFRGPAPIPDGLYFPGFSSADANPDIGDSTITETVGIGAFAMAAAPAIVQFIGGSPADAERATLEMYEITLAEHPQLTLPALGFRGTPVGIDLRKVVELGVTPRVNTGIAHREAGIGQIGAGLVRPPLGLFVAALEAFAEEYL